MYKLGVITTLLTGLTVLSLKGVTIGVILLMLAITSVVAKLSKHNHYNAPYSMSPWASPDPFDRSSVQHQQPQDKNIHVHVHTGTGGPALPPDVVLRNQPPYDSPTTADDNNGPYWNRANEEYYDAAMNHYYHNNHRFSNRDVTESTTTSAYHRWLG